MARDKKATKELKPEEQLEQALVPAEEQPYDVPRNWRWIYLLDSFENHTDSKKKVPRKTYIENGKLAVVDQGQELIGGYTNDENMAFSGILPVIIFGDHTRCIKYIDFPFAQGADGVKVLLPKSFYIPKAFYYALQSIDIPNMGYRRHYPLFSQFSIPLPPLSEQQRMIARIESLFAKLDEAKEKAQSAADAFKLRKSAILHRAFIGKLTEQWRNAHGVGLDSWKKTTISSVSDVKGGKRVPRGMSLTTEHTGHPYIRAGNLKQGTVIDEGIMYVPNDVLQYIRNYTVKAGDVYITNVGACIGDCGVIPKKYDGANLTENAVKMTNLKCNSQFLAYYLSTDNVQQRIKTLTASATLGKLSISNIKKIPVLLPTEEEQAEIIHTIEKIISKELQAKKAAESVLGQIDIMKKTILSRAFRGKLGTNDPNEESAVEMVKRITKPEV